MELLISGLLAGLTIGWYFTKYQMEQRIMDLEDLLQEQDEVVKMQSVYINRMKKKKEKGDDHEVVA